MNLITTLTILFVLAALNVAMALLQPVNVGVISWVIAGVVIGLAISVVIDELVSKSRFQTRKHNGKRS